MAIELKLARHQAIGGLNYQQLNIELGNESVVPEELQNLELPPIDATQGVVISGRAPIWLYGYLVHKLHPTAWVACHDPRLGAVVVETHTRGVSVGMIIQSEYRN